MMLAGECYAATDSFPSGERFGLTSQIRRASTSIANNIAEGCGRDSHRDFARFLRIAYGSACELETQIILAQQRGMGNPTTLDALVASTENTRRMLSGLIRSALSVADERQATKATE